MPLHSAPSAGGKPEEQASPRALALPPDPGTFRANLVPHMRPHQLPLAAAALALGACATTETTEADLWSEQHRAFLADARSAKRAFHNPEVSALLNPETTSIKISLEDQRGVVLHDGEHVAIDFPVSTGKRGFRTTPGDYKVIARRRHHRSNLYGTYVEPESGKVVNDDADTRKDPKPEGAVFRGASMPYFLRLTNTGLGLHVGRVPGYPASHGCVRVPKSIMPEIWDVSPLGTPVTIVPDTFGFNPAPLREETKEEAVAAAGKPTGSTS